VTDFVTMWTPRIYRFALRLTNDVHAAEDLTQETLLRGWSRRDRLRELNAARVWLFRIAVNLWRDRQRRRRSRVDQPASLTEELVASQPPPDQQLEQREELAMVLAALDGLPARQREVLYLNACEEMPLAEIAEVLGINTGAAKASLSLARQKLREQLPESVPEQKLRQHAP